MEWMALFVKKSGRAVRGIVTNYKCLRNEKRFAPAL
jgi:hypothetical protein